MTDSNTHSPPSDELLVAYLDDELDREQRQHIDQLLRHEAPLAARLEQLKRGELPFRAAFDTLLSDAPTAQLQTMLNGLAPASPAQRATLSRRGFLATAAGFVIAGIAADRLFLHWRTAESEDGWRGSVAEYMVLYTPETLDNLSKDSASHALQLRSVGQQLGLPLSPEAVNLPGAEFRRAQILNYDGVLIGQLTYLDPRHGPLALCITAARDGAEKLDREQRLGLNTVYWSDPAHAFMLIGRNPFEDLEIMARSAQKGLSA